MAPRLTAVLFPAAPRVLPYNRGISVGFRTLHLLASGLLYGGHAFDVEPQRLVTLLYLSVVGGLCLILLELYRSCDGVYQGMGVLAIVKVVITGLAGLWWEQRVLLLSLVLILGSVGSHMTARYRHYSFRHGRVLDSKSSRTTSSSPLTPDR